MLIFVIVYFFIVGDLPECARLSGNNDGDDKDLQKALEASSKEAQLKIQSKTY